MQISTVALRVHFGDGNTEQEERGTVWTNGRRISNFHGWFLLLKHVPLGGMQVLSWFQRDDAISRSSLPHQSA